MSGIKPINGMGEAKPVRECEICAASLLGRPVHWVRAEDGDHLWLCGGCYAEHVR